MSHSAHLQSPSPWSVYLYSTSSTTHSPNSKQVVLWNTTVHQSSFKALPGFSYSKPTLVLTPALCDPTWLAPGCCPVLFFLSSLGPASRGLSSFPQPHLQAFPLRISSIGRVVPSNLPLLIRFPKPPSIRHFATTLATSYPLNSAWSSFTPLSPSDIELCVTS